MLGNCGQMADKTSRYVRDEAGQDDELFQTDAFRMFCYKVLPCSKRYSHEWISCPFAHPGEKAKRRDVRVYQYSAIQCPEHKKNGSCPRGDACSYAHSIFEIYLHPSKYRTALCNDGTACHRKVCFFAHTAGEMRSPGSPPQRFFGNAPTPPPPAAADTYGYLNVTTPCEPSTPGGAYVTSPLSTLLHGDAFRSDLASGGGSSGSEILTPPTTSPMAQRVAGARASLDAAVGSAAAPGAVYGMPPRPQQRRSFDAAPRRRSFDAAPGGVSAGGYAREEAAATAAAAAHMAALTDHFAGLQAAAPAADDLATQQMINRLLLQQLYNAQGQQAPLEPRRQSPDHLASMGAGVSPPRAAAASHAMEGLPAPALLLRMQTVPTNTSTALAADSQPLAALRRCLSIDVDPAATSLPRTGRLMDPRPWGCGPEGVSASSGAAAFGGTSASGAFGGGGASGSSGFGGANANSVFGGASGGLGGQMSCPPALGNWLATLAAAQQASSAAPADASTALLLQAMLNGSNSPADASALANGSPTGLAYGGFLP